jgi:hypothetical protein
MTRGARVRRAGRPLVTCGVGLGLLLGVAPCAAPARAQPIVTFVGLAHPTGVPLQPAGGAYQLATGSGVLVIVEGGTGAGTSTFNPGGLPDLQVQVTQPLGNGSTEVCEPLGGVPAISPPNLSFSDVETVNDLACRFSTEPCTFNGLGEPQFLSPMSAVQFCAEIGPTLAFHTGETVFSVRLRGTNGIVGPVSQIHIQLGQVPTASPTRTLTGTPTAGATATPSATAPSATVTRTPSATQPAATQTPTHVPSATPLGATATGAPHPTDTPMSPTPTETAVATRTLGALIDLESLIHALFAPLPPDGTDVNGDLSVNAADVTELFRLHTP